MSSKPKFRTMERERNRSLRGKGAFVRFDDHDAAEVQTFRTDAPQRPATRPKAYWPKLELRR